MLMSGQTEHVHESLADAILRNRCHARWQLPPAVAGTLQNGSFPISSGQKRVGGCSSALEVLDSISKGRSERNRYVFASAVLGSEDHNKTTIFGTAAEHGCQYLTFSIGASCAL